MLSDKCALMRNIFHLHDSSLEILHVNRKCYCGFTLICFMVAAQLNMKPVVPSKACRDNEDTTMIVKIVCNLGLL